MSHENASPPPSTNLNTKYLNSYRTHLSQTSAHLTGADGNTLPPSYIPPTGYWTSSEKDLFFHGLCVHSRLRPDLIADGIGGTKSAVDVCAYLDVLEDAARDDNLSQTNGSRVRDGLEIAMEVSDAWIEKEEEGAEMLVKVEREWEEEAIHARKEQQKKEKRKSLRNPWGTIRHEVDKQRDREGEKRRKELFIEWLGTQERVWEGDEMKRSLGMGELKGLNGLLKEDEAREFEERLGFASRELERDEGETVAHYIPPGGSSAAHASASHNSIPSPALQPSTPQRSVEPPASTPTNAPFIIPKDLTPTSRRRLQKRLHMRRKRAEKIGDGVIASTSLGRLKVGRKRNATGNGAERGREDDPTAEMKDMKAGPSDTMDVNHDADGISISSLPGDPPDDHIVNHNNPHYRIRSQFNDIGISAQSLREEGLGLFNFSSLGRLMNLYKCVHDDSVLDSEENDIITSINYTVLQHLNDHLVRFVTEVLENAIVVREQERKLKEHTKVWQFAKDLITTTNIEYALEMAGAPRWDRKKYFGALKVTLEAKLSKVSAKRTYDEEEGSLRQSGGKRSNGGPSDDEEDSGDEKGDEDAEGEMSDNDVPIGDEDDQDREELPRFSALHRELYPPFIRLPRHLRAEIPPSRHSAMATSAPAEPTDVSEDEHAEEAYLAELREDDRLDLQDRQIEERHERELWDTSDGQPEWDDDLRGMGRNTGHSLKFRKPDPRSGVKSQVYIYDSD